MTNSKFHQTVRSNAHSKRLSEGGRWRARYSLQFAMLILLLPCLELSVSQPSLAQTEQEQEAHNVAISTVEYRGRQPIRVAAPHAPNPMSYATKGASFRRLQSTADRTIDTTIQTFVIERLASLIETGYVVPETGQTAVRYLRSSLASGKFNDIASAIQFAAKLTSELRSVTRDKHIAVYFSPEENASSMSPKSSGAVRERFNFGFEKIERLSGNIGYLDLRSFADAEAGKETASAVLSALANTDAIIIDLRQNGGGNTPMVAYIASYFFGLKPVHFTDMFWRDQNRTVELWTSASVVGPRSERQPLFILVGPSTFSAAEDFAYSLQQLKRATIVGETTGGGAHMGRGLQRLSPLFSAFVPTGMSVNPITKTNWEAVGVKPDIRISQDRALVEAHISALRILIERESDRDWQDKLRRTLVEVSGAR